MQLQILFLRIIRFLLGLLYFRLKFVVCLYESLLCHWHLAILCLYAVPLRLRLLEGIFHHFLMDLANCIPVDSGHVLYPSDGYLVPQQGFHPCSSSLCDPCSRIAHRYVFSEFAPASDTPVPVTEKAYFLLHSLPQR